MKSSLKLRNLLSLLYILHVAQCIYAQVQAAGDGVIADVLISGEIEAHAAFEAGDTSTTPEPTTTPLYSGDEDAETGEPILEITTEEIFPGACEENVKAAQDDVATTTANDGLSNVPVATESASVLEEQTSAAENPCVSSKEEPHGSNCRQYYACSQLAEGYSASLKTCPPKTAFSPEFGRCMRDLSSCKEGLVCEQAGTLPDPQYNSSYYFCVARSDGGFRKYHIQCALGETFLPQLGKCFIDIDNLQNVLPFLKQSNEQPNDEAVVKAELKLIREDEKASSKAQKLKQKLQKKLEKELLKKAAKDAEAQEKLLGSSKESEKFICTQEGNFAAPTSAAHYFSCVSKKGKFKVASVKCPTGHNFDQRYGGCVLINAVEVDSSEEAED